MSGGSGIRRAAIINGAASEHALFVSRLGESYRGLMIERRSVGTRLGENDRLEIARAETNGIRRSRETEPTP